MNAPEKKTLGYWEVTAIGIGGMVGGGNGKHPALNKLARPAKSCSVNTFRQNAHQRDSLHHPARSA